MGFVGNLSGLQECKSKEFFRNRAGGQRFSGGSKKPFFSDRRLPPPDSDNPKSSWGVFSVPLSYFQVDSNAFIDNFTLD